MLTTIGRAAAVVGTVMMACGAASPARAQHKGSMEDQMACTPDVYRLCSSFVPDEDAITNCLRRNLQALSPACHQVFTRPDTSAAPAAPAGGDQDTD